MLGKLRAWAKRVRDATERSGSTAVAKRADTGFVGAILVVAVPAYFTFVPPEPAAPVWPRRDLIMAAWLLVLIWPAWTCRPPPAR